MDTLSTAHSAEDAALGFYFQGLFALLLLVDADDDAGVRVEAGDDVELTGSTPTLAQLKHSMGDPPPLTISNEGFWKTLRIWAPHAGEEDLRFVFVTRAAIAGGDPLQHLAGEDGGGAAKVVKALTEEAERVAARREAQRARGQRLSYESRIAGVEAFRALHPATRRDLVGRIRIAARQPNAGAVDAELRERLGSFLAPTARFQVVERLIEWWDRQVACSLLARYPGASHRRPPTIYKRELQNKLHELIASTAGDNLPDDFGDLMPTSLAEGLSSLMERQIRLVDDGKARLRRAALARWRARNQRDRWLRDEISLAPMLEAYDAKLEARWSERHEPMQDDYATAGEVVQREKGRDLLDWSHHQAPEELPPVRTRWGAPFYVQGMYQQLAEELRVGWHPRFRELLAGGSNDDTEES